MGAGGGNQEGTPLMWNNTLYGITTWSVVFALDARTGKELWRWDPRIDQVSTRPAICCGNVNRGIAIYNGMIIAPAIDGRLVALDAITGKLVWESRVVNSGDLYTLTMAPRIAGGKVIIGASGGDKPTRGNFIAVDARTGKLAWRVYTVPGDPSLPFENEAMRVAAKTWGGDFFKNGGGGAVWDGFAYDPEANLVYVGTGNAQPWVQKFRGAQGLDNLYTCSILAVDLTTGQIKWHYQAVPNDNWDYDNVQQLTLLDLPINGRMRKVITQAPKNGFFYVLDRVTGEFISAEPFVKVSWALRMGADGRPVVNPAAYYDQEPISVFPTGGGAHNWSPMSYNPNTGLVYIPASYQSYPYQAQAELRPGSTGYQRPRGETKTIEPSFGPEPIPGARNGLQAWDPVNQKLRWNVAGGGGIGGGTATTAGNLVFQTINDGRFRAISADKGEVLYEVRTGRTGMKRIQNDPEPVAVARGEILLQVIDDDPRRLVVVGEHTEVQRLVVIEHSNLGVVGRRRAFTRLVLNEAARRGRTAPRSFVNHSIDGDGTRRSNRREPPLQTCCVIVDRGRWGVPIAGLRRGLLRNRGMSCEIG